MPTLSAELVNRYIEKAEAVAGSKAERLVVQLAAEIHSPPQDIRDAIAVKSRDKSRKPKERFAHGEIDSAQSFFFGCGQPDQQKPIL